MSINENTDKYINDNDNNNNDNNNNDKKIVIIAAEGCGACEDIVERIKDRDDIELVYLSKEAVAELVRDGVEVEVPTAMKGEQVCKFEVEDGKLYINCGEEKVEL